MYLQTARYVLKGYRNYLTKGKKLPYSLQYMARMPDFAGKKWSGNDAWTAEELRDIVVKGIENVLQQIANKIMTKK